jgi:hypothetical protein
MKIVGIDAGLKGGIAILGTVTNSIEYYKMPIQKIGKYNVVDSSSLEYIIREADIIGIEKQHVRGNQGGSLAIGGNYYMLLWACRNSNFKEILPQKWMNAFPLVPVGQRRTKAHHIDYVNNYWGLNLTKKDDGIADAILIAMYIQKQLKYVSI